VNEVTLPDEYTDDPPGVGVNDPITLRDALRLAVAERDKAIERAERWEKAYGRLEAKLANARIKTRALAGALD